MWPAGWHRRSGTSAHIFKQKKSLEIKPRNFVNGIFELSETKPAARRNVKREREKASVSDSPPRPSHTGDKIVVAFV